MTGLLGAGPERYRSAWPRAKLGATSSAGRLAQGRPGGAGRNGQILWIAGPPDHAAPSVWLVGLVTSLLGCASAVDRAAGVDLQGAVALWRPKAC